MKRVVLVVGVWCCMAWLAASRSLPLGVLFDDLAHKSQHAPYNVADYNLAWLRRRQPPADLLDALNELGSVSPFELAHYAQEQGRRGNGAWP